MSESLSCYTNSHSESLHPAEAISQQYQPSLHDFASIKSVSYPQLSKTYNSFIIGKMRFSKLDSSNGLEVQYENILDELDQQCEEAKLKDCCHLSDISETAATKKLEPKKKRAQEKQSSNKNISKKKNLLSITVNARVVNDIKIIQSINFSSSFIEFYRQTSDEFQTSFHSLPLEDQTYYAIFQTAFDKITENLKEKYAPYICPIENYLNRKIDTKVCIEVTKQSSKDENNELLICQIGIIPMDYQSTTNPNLFNKRREGIQNNKSKKAKRNLSEQEKQFLLLYKECNINPNLSVQSDILNYFQTCKYRKIEQIEF
ncbi:hypothetical protein TTHERM_00289110 (macronuclear) [Tetrahymena thermophila SB210]|uniref:Uncharacterized protein n=1 Tax=Tetrahymena thermophila (strain SB210) TaxID=312017 RepID=I7M231_TETTS|nr:hypothetical protein TTHERM_00289110 [Tetrahymena thermophila SB210]EAR98383.1 hypothetical protein TTHERM_00289110 [Tetrahymena thermophila SB210]|eukprot:XP_001018628.1 hypothetical protein TTHERM_00289110 [Tetrahymena thermophila SB210]